jgi:ATP-binding cassette subfamily B protein
MKSSVMTPTKVSSNGHPFLEAAPADIGQVVDGQVAAGETVLIRVATDMTGIERFEERWFVVTDRQLLFIGANANDQTTSVPLSAVRQARVEALVGAGRLEVERSDESQPHYLYYSSSLSQKFTEVAEAIQRLSTGDEVALPTKLERSRCEKCHRALPEKDGVCPACIKKLDTLRRLIGYMMANRAKLMVLLLVMIGEVLADLVPPYITKNIINEVLIPWDTYWDATLESGAEPGSALKPDFGESLLLLSKLVLIALAANLFGWGAWIMRRWLQALIGLRAMEQIRIDLYKAMHYVPLRYHDKRKVGSLISRMSNDSDLVEAYIIFDMPYVVVNAMTVVGILSLMFYNSWQLALLVLLPVPPIIAVSSVIWKRMGSYWQRWSAKWSRLSSHINESIRGIRVVKAFAQEQREGERFERRNTDLRDISVSSERSWLVFFLVTNFIMSFGVFLVWYFGGSQIVYDSHFLGVDHPDAFKVGDLMFFIMLLWMLYQPLKWFGDFYGFMLRAYAGAERIFEVIDTNMEPFDDPTAVPIPRVEGAVVFRNASFGYDSGKPVLKDVDLEVRPGEMIGLVGKSGVGKTTMINLITRFYDVTRGSLEIDGTDIRELRLEDLRQQMGLVAQQSFLFNTTIAENISYGKPGASFGEVLRASRAANAHEFIITKADGYDMVVGEHGDRLSGGEKQRISIARAILHDPKILILDEATSSLDTPTEAKIQQAIARLVKGRTTFAIAHRLSTLRSANRLVVLDAGKVAEVGTHEELMERKGFFYKLVMTQQESSEMAAIGGDHGEQNNER